MKAIHLISPGAVGRVLARVASSSTGELAGRSVNIVLPLALLAIHPPGHATDLFFMLMTVAAFSNSTLSNSLSAALVPQLVGDTQPRSILRILVAAGLIGAITSGLAMLWAGLDKASIAWISGGSVFVICASGLIAAPAVATHNAQHRYALPGLTWALRFIPLILYILARPEQEALHWLLLGIAMADFGRAFILLRFNRHRLNLLFRARPIEMPVVAGPLIAGTIVVGIIPLAARAIAAGEAPGMLSIFEFADRLYLGMASLATIGIGSVVLVYLSHMRNQSGDADAFGLMLVAAALWALAWLFAGLAVWSAFDHLSGWVQLSQSEMQVAARTFMMLVLGLPPFVLCVFIARRFLAAGFGRGLLIVAIINAAVGLSLAWALCATMSVPGIALGLSIGQYSALLAAFFLLRSLPRHAYSVAV